MFPYFSVPVCKRLTLHSCPLRCNKLYLSTKKSWALTKRCQWTNTIQMPMHQCKTMLACHSKCPIVLCISNNRKWLQSFWERMTITHQLMRLIYLMSCTISITTHFTSRIDFHRIIIKLLKNFKSSVERPFTLVIFLFYMAPSEKLWTNANEIYLKSHISGCFWRINWPFSSIKSRRVLHEKQRTEKKKEKS